MTRVEEARSTEIARRIKSGGRHGTGELSEVHAVASRCINAEAVRAHTCRKSVVMLRLGSKDGSILQRLNGSVRLMLNEERRHGVVSEHREVDGSRNGTTTLSLVTTRGRRTHEAHSRILEDAGMGVYQVVRLTCRSEVDRRDRGRSGSHGKVSWVEHCVTVLERVERHELGQLTAESLGGATKLVHHDFARLLVLGEVTALVEATATRAVHVELRRTNQLNHQCAQSLRSALCSGRDFTLDKVDVLDPSEWVFDLVAGRIVVDVVCDASFFR